jgi:hypothetical protein
MLLALGPLLAPELLQSLMVLLSQRWRGMQMPAGQQQHELMAA